MNIADEKPWYPDDRNWIEHDGSGQPVGDKVWIHYLFAIEREYRVFYNYSSMAMFVTKWDWEAAEDGYLRVVAYIPLSAEETQENRL